jgi:hypothetical protein
MGRGAGDGLNLRIHKLTTHSQRMICWIGFAQRDFA